MRPNILHLVVTAIALLLAGCGSLVKKLPQTPDSVVVGLHPPSISAYDRNAPPGIHIISPPEAEQLSELISQSDTVVSAKFHWLFGTRTKSYLIREMTYVAGSPLKTSEIRLTLLAGGADHVILINSEWILFLRTNQVGASSNTYEIVSRDFPRTLELYKATTDTVQTLRTIASSHAR